MLVIGKNMTDKIETYFKGYPIRYVLNKVGYLLANPQLTGGVKDYQGLMEQAITILDREKHGKDHHRSEYLSEETGKA